jgi:glycosyltransferase involved in cell wall biosynthesis
MRFRAEDRMRVRAELGWQNAVVGVYAGKFGGLYHRERSFAAFAAAQRIIGPGSGLIILTSEPEEQVRAGLAAAGFNGDRLLVRYARHEEVAAHLSAADFAFAPYRGTPSSACISPMKIGEYWANGLPVLLTRGVGDDSAIISEQPLAGALFDPEGVDINDALSRILEVLQRPYQRKRTSELAERYRSMELTVNAYRETFAAFAR